MYVQRIMDKYKLIDTDNKDNTEKNDIAENNMIINKFYSNDNKSEKQSSKPEYVGLTKFKDAEESEKYIKEMHELADKNEFKNNLVVILLALFVVAVIIFSIAMKASFTKEKVAVSKSKIVAKDTNDTTPAAIIDVNPTETSPDTLNKDSLKLYEYLNVLENRASVLSKSIELNNGSKNGITVYLLSEILRANTYDIPVGTSSVKDLVTALTSLGFKKNSDFTQLEKGDICFTTDVPENPATPSHTYIFMSWVEDGKTDYANICDGQVQEFGTTLHKRNLSISTDGKDQFSFFMEK